MSSRNGRSICRQKSAPIRSRPERFDLPKELLRSTGRYPLLGSVNSRDASETPYKPRRLLRPFTKRWRLRRLLVNQNFDVRFPDLENSGRADISFEQGPVNGLIECKALSADAGRKIHRKHFYRFMDAISQQVFDRMSGSGVNELILITLKDRLSSHLQNDTPLVRATRDLLRSNETSKAGGHDFEIIREPYATLFNPLRPMSEREFYAEAQKQFGTNCHIAGGWTETGGCLVLMRSEREDDHSKPQLEAMKEAAQQLPTERPGFIALQFNEISSADLALPHLRRRSAILCNYLFHATPADHVAGVYICAFGALSADADAAAYPAIVIWNPRFKFDGHGLPFRSGVSDAAFAKLVNARNLDASGRPKRSKRPGRQPNR